MISHLTALVTNNNVNLLWTAPASESAQLKYGDGVVEESVYGDPEGIGFSWGQRFTPVELSPYAGMALTSVELYSYMVDEFTLSILKETEDAYIELEALTFSNTAPGWCVVTLPEPIPIDYENSLLVTFFNDCSEYQYMASYTEDFEGGNNASLYWEDGYWYTMDPAISWLIRTNISDDSYTYSIYRDDQLIASNVTQTSYNDNNMPQGRYQYFVRTQYYGSLSEPSESVSVVIGSSTDETDDSGLEFYPNPTNGKVTLQGEAMESVTVVSMTGQQLATIKVNNDHAEVDLTDYHPGVYVLLVRTGDGEKIIRISRH